MLSNEPDQSGSIPEAAADNPWFAKFSFLTVGDHGNGREFINRRGETPWEQVSPGYWSGKTVEPTRRGGKFSGSAESRPTSDFSHHRHNYSLSFS
jgi:hypothetical protein